MISSVFVYDENSLFQRCPAIAWAMNQEKNCMDLLDVTDMVTFRIKVEKCKMTGRVIKLPDFQIETTNNKITIIKINGIDTGKKFLPIERANNHFRQMILESLGNSISRSHGDEKLKYISCIKYLWTKGILTISSYCNMCRSCIYGKTFQENEFQINPLMRFFKFNIPLSYNDMPCLNLYLLDGMETLTCPIFDSDVNFIVAINIILRAIAVDSCREVALISCLLPDRPEELYTIVLFYMILNFKEPMIPKKYIQERVEL